MPQDIDVGIGPDRRRVAVLGRAGRAPAIVWFGGFRSEMRATKADALDAWADDAGRAFLRFDYSGHGASEGDFREGTISRWLEEALAVLGAHGGERPVLVGSSMGAWLALLAARALREAGSKAPSGLVLLAPATDFTEALMWAAFSDDVRATIERDGVHFQPSGYSDEPYPITRGLIEDGRRHLLLDGPLPLACPVHIIQGMKDPDVPWRHALRLTECLPDANVSVTLVKDGDHRLSRPEDLDRMIAAVEAACEGGRPPP